jgi:hypothetical protein
MQLKKVMTYRIPFRSKGITWCGIFLGLSVFLRCFYYFVPCDFSDWNAGIWILNILLPILLCATFGILIKVVLLRSPGIYGILAAAMCFVLFISDMVDDNLVQVIVSVVTMPLLGLLLLATYGGYIPLRSISAVALFFVAILRMILFAIADTAAWRVSVSEILILTGLLCFTVSLKPLEIQS